MLNFFATSAVDSGLPPASVTISMPEIFWMASMCLMPKAPWPATQTFMTRILSSRLHAQQSRCRVRRRHAIETIRLTHLRPQCAAHGQPHDHLDTLGARLAHVLGVRDLRQLLGVVDHAVEEILVEFLVHEAGAFTLQL